MPIRLVWSGLVWSNLAWSGLFHVYMSIFDATLSSSAVSYLAEHSLLDRTAICLKRLICFMNYLHAHIFSHGNRHFSPGIRTFRSGDNLQLMVWYFVMTRYQYKTKEQRQNQQTTNNNQQDTRHKKELLLKLGSLIFSNEMHLDNTFYSNT
ncbi:hypothetical protein K501DRAFT_274304 [Backusella circina FSU 941]|nr:hypothetical protein K501DRAFT_274304 [Backusella circina FSU 941]